MFSVEYVALIGREAAAWQFIQCYRYRLTKEALKYTRDINEAEDFVSEAALWATKFSSRWDSERKTYVAFMLEWLFYKISHAAAKRTRQTRTNKTAVAVMTPFALDKEKTFQSPDPIGSIDREVDAAQILYELKSYDAEAEIVFREHFLNGLSYRDIALKYRTSHPTVRARIQVAKEFIARKLRDRYV